MHTASFWNITIQWTSYDDFTDFLLCLSFLNSNWKNLWNQSAKKVTQMIWQNFSLLALRNVSKSSNQSGSQIHAWILLKKKIYYISFHSSFCRTSPFHREWLALINNLMIKTFFQKANQNLLRLWPIEAIHCGKDLSCKN